MDNVTETAARNVVDAMIEARESFSAFDVTSQLRQQGHQVSHRGMDGVRNFVHLCYTSGDGLFPDHYVRSLIDFGKGQTFIFHPHDVDVNDYDPDKWQPVKTDDEDDDSVNVNVPVPVTVDDGKIGTDKRGRLCIRASFIRQLGVNPGNEVIVYIDTCEIWRHHSNRSTLNSSVLKVDKDRCIRIAPGTLDKMFNKPSKSLRFTLVLDHLGFIKVMA